MLVKEGTELELTDHEVILIDSEYNDFLKSHHGYEVWQPSITDIQMVRNSLKQAIKNDEFKVIKKPVEEYITNFYYFQYVPYLDESKNQIMLINSFCETQFADQLAPVFIDGDLHELNVDWTNQLIQVSDGGFCYWSMEVNLDTGTYFNLYINGNG